MATILNIETSTKVCSIALGRDNKVVAFNEAHEDRFTHAENLNRFIDDCLKQAHITFQDLDAVAVSGGPGSYTGLRIGVSSAKGFCYALDIPLIAVDTLMAMARHVQNGEGHIVPMIDARRMEVFCAAYDGHYQVKRPVDAVILEADSFSDLQGPLYVLGDGAPKFADISTRSDVQLIDAFPTAKNMVALSNQAFAEKSFVDTAYYEPFYLKDFIAGKPKKLL